MAHYEGYNRFPYPIRIQGYRLPCFFQNRDFPFIEELDPEWTELIGNASAPMDEEAQLLMEAGIYEEFSFDVLDFDRFIPELVFEREAKKRERHVVVVFVMGMVVFLLLSRYISPIKV